jgi:hypothetical protein
LQVVAQRDALDELGDDGGQAVEAGDLVDGDDVGVAELGGGAGLAEEALAVGIALQHAGMGQLQGDEAVQFGAGER